MTSVTVKGIKVKDGKLVRKRQYRAKNKALKTDRLVKAWEAKGKK